jgi:GTP cyclohydrolase IA
MCSGYNQNPKQILTTTFEENCDEMVIVKGIHFTSLCEHHILPFIGEACVAYLPSPGRIVGLSKLARLVDCFAKRLQVQERLTAQIAKALMDYLKPQGAGVILKASHECMACRGVNKTATMVTSSLLGAFRDNERTRSEFLTLAGG